MYKLCQRKAQKFLERAEHCLLLAIILPTQPSTYPEDRQKYFGNSETFLHRPTIPMHSGSIAPQQLSQECEGTTETPPSCWSGAEGAANQKRDMPPSIDAQEDCNTWMRYAWKCSGFDLYCGGREASGIARRIWRGRQVSQ